MCDTQYPIFELSNGVRYWMSHADPYFYIHNVQVYLMVALLAFIIIKSIERKLFLQLINFLPLIFCFFFWINIENIKSTDINDSSKYIDLLRETVYYSRLIISLISALFILQIIVLSKSILKNIKTI